MDERTLQQLFAELIEAQGHALGLVVSALCRQVDPARLTADLRQAIAAARTVPSIPPLALRLATTALAAADAERMLQAKPPSEADRPIRD